MRNHFLVVASVVLGIASVSVAEQPIDIGKKIGQYASVSLNTDIRLLSDNQKKMIPLLIQAAQIMDECFWYEAYGSKTELLASIVDPSQRRFAKINYGPWDRLDNNQPFVSGVGKKPAGANYYPPDMTKREFETAKLTGKDGLYTFVRRQADGSLTVVPYREQFASEMKAASKLLRRAARLAEDAGLRRYLLLRRRIADR